MDKLSKVLIVGPMICVFVALIIKMSTLGRRLPGPFPINWAKLADTILLFSIALSLLGRKETR